MAAAASKLERDDVPLRELERGRITFLIRPKIDTSGIQSFMLALSELEGAEHRRIVIGKKHLPRAGKRDREWSYVAKVGSSRRELLEGIGPTTYMTKTKGLRHQPGARPVAEGSYRILGHGEHAHLDYEVDREDVEEGDRELLAALGIEPSGSMIVAVFNPLAKWSREATLRYRGSPDDPAPFREPSIFPDALQAVFGDRRFAPLDPAFLAYEGAELVLLDGRHSVATP